MKLVIVESPTKCITIGKYLGEDYNVVASLGHVRDLSTRGKDGLGVDVNNDFKAYYIVQPKQYKVVRELRARAKKADEVILATDPDREGEAIAWHLATILGLDIATTKRLEFHEITRQAVIEAINNPRTIDMNLVSSQETRRVLDRIIGFKLSKLLQKKIKSRSAGRVQSTSLKLITDRENEIASFIPEEYWTISVSSDVDNNSLLFDLVKIDGKEPKLNNEDDASACINRIGDSLHIDVIKKEKKVRESKPPFITSTLQQEAFNKYKFSTKKTSLVAQKLYEGITLKDETVGLITYMRTDSTRLSPQFVEKLENHIVEKYGEEYLGKIKSTKKKGKVQIQDAHEAIRPTNLKYDPESIKKYLTSDEYKLYSLIYYHTVASMMAPRIDEVTTVLASSNNLTFKLEGNILVYDGYQKVLPKEEKDKILPTLNEGMTLSINEKNKEQHFTKAPARYSEAKLVKTMEELGIGRPSTYASTIEILKARKYVSVSGGTLIPSEQGQLTIEMLSKYFTKLIDPSFTAKMELDLDNIQAGSESRLKLLTTFYQEFESLLKNAKEEMPLTPDELTGEICPECGSPMVYKTSRFGKFEACSNYPKCKYIKHEAKPEIPQDAPRCPECGKPLVIRKNKKGEEFYGCSGFPRCRYIRSLNEGSEKPKPEVVGKCPECGGDLIIKSGKYSKFIGCSNYPNCKHMEKIKKEK